MASELSGNWAGNLAPLAQGLGGLSSLFGLAQGIRGGNTAGIVGSLPGVYSAASGLSGGALPSLTAMLGPALGATPVVGTVMAAITSYLNNMEAQQAKNSGWLNNPIKGALSSSATAGVGNAQQILDQITVQGLGTMPTEALLASVAPITNALLPYYATAQGGRGAIKASDTFTGGTGPAASTPLGGAEQYTANFTRAQQGLTGVVQELLKRGVSYEQLGATPVTNDWGQQTMDLANPLMDFYNRGNYSGEGSRLLNPVSAPQVADPSTIDYTAMDTWGNPLNPVYGQLGATPAPSPWSPVELLQAAQGAAPYAADKATHAGGLLSSMYGGPLWQALARMGVGGPEMQGLIQQHFDPWVNARNWNQTQLADAFDAQRNVRAMEAADIASRSAP